MSVTYQTTDGTARGGADFAITDGVLSFIAGSADGATRTVVVGVTSDSLDEDD